MVFQIAAGIPGSKKHPVHTEKQQSTQNTLYFIPSFLKKGNIDETKSRQATAVMGRRGGHVVNTQGSFQTSLHNIVFSYQLSGLTQGHPGY